jgi:hypothetical protein
VATAGSVAALFFYPLGNGIARHAGGPGDATQRVAFEQQLVYLRVLPGFFHHHQL